MLHPYSLGMVARRFALGMLGLTFATAAQAQLGTYSFGTTTPSTGDEATYAVDAQPTNATFSPISRGTGVTPSGAGGTFSALGWTLGATPDATDYFSFSVTPAADHKLDLTSITLDERRSGTGIGEWVLRSSLDNFTADLIKVTVPDETLVRNKKIDLPAAFMGLTSAVEFRFYGYKAEADAGTWRLDNIKVDGTVTGGVVTPTAPVISFGTAAVTVEENVGKVNIPVKLSAASTQEITVDVVIATPAGTATSPDDFTFTKTKVTFPANSTAEKTVEVTIVDDNVQEAAETIILGLENAMPADGATIASGTSTITIAANDVPTVISVTPISTLTVNDAAGVPVQNGQIVKATGVIYGPNLRTAGGYQFALIDATGGIGIFSSANIGDLTLAEGDSVDVMGTLGQFNGLTQITATAIERFRQNAALVAPRVVTAVGEGEESELIKLTPLMLADASKWPTAATTASGVNVDAKDAAGNTFQLRITKASGLYTMPAPTGAFTVTGLGGQFDSATPFDTGYQIFPRSMADIVSIETANREPAFGRTVQLYPNPAANQLTLKLGTVGRGATVEVLSLLGQRISRTTATGTQAELNVAALQRGTYLVRITTNEGSVTRRFVKQ
ncbi:T9SS type A sorting domain-containing protein [Hymenobacter guriensis]|uniref:T9SS type A sorting domain-containing protein n=1 Tax=Hymenobacter guriensis TaxID=2793065 RepID=A0ABS0KWR3_9BACT|nr:T9SS type A sorting domain-containing protein [Hymenobacter guriensis]MBG8552210.1 T9SS type A sorting domain-containing protein [Hymenobacter guriensis]